MMKLSLFTLALICLVSTSLRAEVRLTGVITDHAVLQRDVPIHVWGEASPAEKITLTFHDQSIATTATSLGLWEAWLKPEPAGGPFTLTIHGSSELTRSDLLVGDVWFASGQSNMEMPLAGFPPSAHVANASQEIAQAELPQVRLLRMEHQSSASPLAGISAVWQPCTPETAKDFSAVAYFFAREINRREHVPIGVIDSSWGGTPIDSWISLDALSSDASLLPAFAARAHFADMQTHLSLIESAEKSADAEAAAHNLPKPSHPWHPDPMSWIPAGLYNGMVAPFTPYAIKGLLWYQGETDSAPDPECRKHGDGCHPRRWSAGQRTSAGQANGRCAPRSRRPGSRLRGGGPRIQWSSLPPDHTPRWNPGNLVRSRRRSAQQRR
jgi:sialate O-acetylesterase